MQNKPCLIIIENRAFVREYLEKVSRLLKPTFQVVIISSISELLTKRFGKKHPDIIVLSVNSYVFADCAVTNLQNAFGTKTPIILFDNAINYAIIRMVFHRKLGGYFSIFNSLNDFVDIVKLVHDGKQVISQAEGEMIQTSGEQIDEKLNIPLFLQLSNREYELLCHIVNGDEQEEISKKMEITIKSVENIKTRLMQKLNVHSTSKLILIGIRYGLGAR
jgi:DNA-binding NarL/FixJ family response regulator